MPWRIAPAWPVTPPPSTLIIALKWPSVPVTRNGIFTSDSFTALPKCSSRLRPLTTISPSPGSSRTRAIAVLRRPVPEKKAGVLMRSGSSGERLRPLGLMGMVCAGVALQLAELLHAQRVPGQHALDRPPDDFLGAPLEQMAQRLLLVALRVAAVADVELRLALVAADRDARRVQDDHMVAGVEVGLPGRLVLALEDARDPRRQAAKRLVGGIDDVPAPLDLAFACRVGLRAHRFSSVSCSVRSICFPAGRPRATRRRLSPCAGADAPSRAGTRAANATRTPVSSILPRPTSRRTAAIRLTIPRRKASALTSIVTSDPLLLTRTECTVRTGFRSAAPKAEKSCRPSRTSPARAIAAVSSGTRTPSAVRSRSGLRGPFQTV